ncbi:MAG TPA: hypothetical protein PLJ12_05930 [Planctomycetota bacterium]|nr:hypothetical protein [Planctomycetota bacterium]
MQRSYHQSFVFAATIAVLPTLALAGPFQNTPVEPPVPARSQAPMQVSARPAATPLQGVPSTSPPEAWHAPQDGATFPVLGPKPPIVDSPDESYLAAPDDELVAPSMPALGQHIHDQMHYDLQGADHWALGKLYKACANPDGFRYMPYLGSDAPKTYEVTMRLGSSTLGGLTLGLDDKAQVQRAGDRITLDRGAIEVWYDMGLDGVEQSFALNRGHVDGDWVLNLDVQSELGFEQQADGIAYLNDLGGVVYRHAVVVDGAGRRLDLPILADQASVRLVVPAAFMRSAVAPVVVDPVFTTFQVHAAYAHDLQYPDVAYDLGTDRFAYVHQSEFSSTDYDVFIETFSSTGAFAANAWVDFTNSDVRTPSVANDNTSDQYLVVARRLNATAYEVIGRAVSAVTLTTQSPVFVIGDANASWTNTRVDVGGKSQGTPLFMAVWERSFTSPAQTDVRGSFVTPVVPISTTVAPSVTPYFLLSNTSTYEENQVRVSESSGKNTVATWRVAYIRTEIATGDQAIMASAWADNGTMTSPETLLGNVNSAYTTVDLDVSAPLADLLGPGGGPLACMPVYYTHGSFYDVWVYGLEGNNLFSETLLRASEHVNPAARPRYPSVAALATRFVVSYIEFDGDYTCYSTAVDFTNLDQWAVNDRRAVVSAIGATSDFGRPASASRYSGGNYSSRYVGVGVTRWDGTYWVQDGAVEYPAAADSPAAQYCAGNPNSTGDYGFITMWGTPSTTTSKTLVATAMPLNQFGYFLAGQNGFGVVAVPGSAGNLCLSGGPLGRYNLGVEVFFTGTSGSGQLAISPTALRGPGGNVVGLAGQTWNFQAWHRENGGSSNFTNAISLFLE